MKQVRHLIGILFALLIVVSCSKPNIIVLDSAGHPIEGASVEPITLSMNGAALLTDANGAADITEGAVQSTKWISVTKAGYTDSGHIEFDQAKPTQVVLRK